MLAFFTTSVRVAVLAAALAFTAQGALAGPTAAAPQPTATARTTARTPGEGPAAERGDGTLDGTLIIVGIVGVVILLAWVCSRVGDTR
jgi:hypothetical protein